jgi:hypothetical protein
MRRSMYFGVPGFLLVGAIAFSCGGSSNPSGFGPAGSKDGGGSSSGDDGGSSSGGDDVSIIGNGDGMSAGCTGIECNWQPCSSMGKPETTLTGTVYDPAGNLPLYNVYVYVPNKAVDPITAGNPYCSACEAPATGSPIIGAQTDPQGHFSIQFKPGASTYGVPSGTNVPLVIQEGKWRKQLTIPMVAACQTTDLDATFNMGTGKARQMRLPANGSEGDMPLMAFTSGCDPAECFLRHIGIDDAEFAPPGTAGKHVHFYTAWDGPTGSSPASSVSGGNTPAQTYSWWSSAANLLKYDIIFDACECTPNPRGNTAYKAMQDYLDGGGRLFTTHYYYNWFTDMTGGATEYQSVVSWNPGGAQTYNGYYIDTSFPKGQAYGAWLLANSIATGSMSSGIQIGVTDTRNDVDTAGMPSYPDSTRWIYNANNPGSSGGPPASYSSAYVSFNAPLSPPPAPDGGAGVQCGKAVFSDVHLSGSSNNQTFPAECATTDPGHITNEKALEFLFFDLSSCVQNDQAPPPPPPPQ